MQNKLSTTQATLIMLNTMFGIGILYLPRTFHSLGYVQGTVVFVVVGGLTFLTMVFLGYAYLRASERNMRNSQNNIPSNNNNQLKNIPPNNKTPLTFYSVLKQSNPLLAPLADTVIFLDCLFVCITYLSLITNITHYETNIPRTFLITFFTCVIFVLVVQRELKKLRWVSYLSLFSVLYFTFFVFYSFYVIRFSTQDTSKAFGTEDGSKPPIPVGFTPVTHSVSYDYSTGISDLLFALGCQQNLITVLSHLKSQDSKTMLKVSFFSVLMGMVLYGLVGVVGYLAYGQFANTNVLTLLSHVSFKGSEIGNDSNPTDSNINSVSSTDHSSIVRNTLLSHSPYNLYLIRLANFSFILTLCCSFAFQAYPARISFFNVVGMIFRRRFNSDIEESEEMVENEELETEESVEVEIKESHNLQESNNIPSSNIHSNNISTNWLDIHTVYSVFYMLFILFIVKLDINTDLLVTWIGAVCCNLLCYILPSLAYIGSHKSIANSRTGINRNIESIRIENIENRTSNIYHTTLWYSAVAVCLLGMFSMMWMVLDTLRVTLKGM